MEKVESVDVVKQYKIIDVLLIVNGNVAVIIEDKTFTSAHNNHWCKSGTVPDLQSFYRRNPAAGAAGFLY